jgi:GntR family transcriptional regulator
MPSHPPLYLQIQQFLRQGIAAGEFKPGERVPSEPELARRFATTRATVARAFQQLAFEGVVDRRTGSGTFVGTPLHGDRVDTGVIASQEERLRAAGASIRYELIGFALAKANAHVAAGLGLVLGAPVYRLQRLRRAGTKIIALEDRHLPEAIGRDIRSELLEVHTVQYVLTETLGLRIATIDNAVSAAIASPQQARRLGVKRGSPLLVREHLILDTRARAILFGKTVYPGDFSVRYTLSAAAR